MRTRGIPRGVLAAACLAALLSCSAGPPPRDIAEARLALQDAKNASADQRAPREYDEAVAHFHEAQSSWDSRKDADLSAHWARLAWAEARRAQYVALAAAEQDEVTRETERRRRAELAVREAEIARLQARADTAKLVFPGEEKFLANVRQLTFGGQNAEAYWSADGKQIIFQSNDEGHVPCDQIFIMNADGSGKRMVSNGKGKTTCSYFFPSGDRVLYSSTFRAGEACPPPPDRSRGYVWALDDYDIYTAKPDGSDIRTLFSSPAYDAEATVSRDGRKIVFTSARDGDLEIYSMNADGSAVTRLTHTPGYDGGPFYSYDGKKIVYRADHPKTAEDLALYRENLARGTYAPKGLEIRVMNADGSDDHAVTANGAANFAPYFFPDGKRIIYSSNAGDPKGRDFELYVVNADGTDPTRVTYSPEFDGFPMFNSDGTRLVFASNRNGKQPRETNIFVADWVGPR